MWGRGWGGNEALVHLCQVSNELPSELESEMIDIKAVCIASVNVILEN